MNENENRIEGVQLNPRPQSRFICAWCGEDLGPSETLEDSHGICERCKREYLSPNKENRRG